MLSNLIKSKFILFIILSFAIHCVASYFSVGFYSQDEHFQILSPVEFLLGINDNLSKEIWEFGDCSCSSWNEIFNSITLTRSEK